MSTNTKDLSEPQRKALLVMSATMPGLTTKEIEAKTSIKNAKTMLDVLRQRGLVKAHGHYSPSRCYWTLTLVGLDVQKLILAALPN